MEVYERIKEIRKEFFNDSNIEFANFMGEKTSTTSGWVSGKRGIGRSVIDKITSKLPKINPAWLLTGEGNMINQPEPSIQPNAHVVESLNYMNVPVVHIKARCGYLSGYGDAEYIDSLPTMPVIVDKTYHGKYMIFEAEGDSMDDGTRNSFEEGDVLLVRELGKQHWRDKFRFNDHPYWVIVFDSSILIKQMVAQNLETGDLTFHSLNPSPEYTDFILNVDRIRALYYVLQKKPKTVKF